ncbi:MAG: hypothetical protein H7319_15915 [Spirosoma sp.]|nr:hypothetical protein [Spirosoma sp.]
MTKKELAGKYGWKDKTLYNKIVREFGKDSRFRGKKNFTGAEVAAIVEAVGGHWEGYIEY